MGLNTFSSDYGSGSSMNSFQSTSWGSQELDWQTFQSQLLNPERPRTKAASFADLVHGRCTIEDVMQEFRMNGSDCPYPDDDQYWTRKTAEMPSNTASYMRQKSWPAPDRTPSQRLQMPNSVSFPMKTAQPILSKNEASELPHALPASEGLTEEQLRVLSSLPDAAVLTLLREMQRKNKRQPDECRFCKNNGERESYYRSHVLKDRAGRVACPVLRAFVCRRCGARGDCAHTIKYCPLTTSEERIKSAAMMRSVRLSSGRRRAPSPARADNYVVFGSPPPTAPPAPPTAPPTVLADGDACRGAQGAPLDPLWAQLEQKLML